MNNQVSRLNIISRPSEYKSEYDALPHLSPAGAKFQYRLTLDNLFNIRDNYSHEKYYVTQLEPNSDGTSRLLLSSRFGSGEHLAVISYDAELISENPPEA